jgi:hypothetical protein
MERTMRLLSAILLTLPVALFAVPSAAQPRTTVRGESKYSAGTLRSATNGDIACYLEFSDDAGQPFSEMADFDLCIGAEALVGQRLRLHYTVAKVQAASCQGDPDCSATDEVALVDRMDALPAAATAGGFCQAGETVVFGCGIASGKWVNVCSDVRQKPARLQYRFGAPGKLELALPPGGASPDPKVYGRSESYSGGGAAWLGFRNGDYRYVVYTGIGRWGPNGETRERAGVAVEKSGRTVAHFACTSAVRSVLGPDWYPQFGFAPERDEAFLIPE